MNKLLQDLRYGKAMMWKRPGFTLVALTALALGIGANTAIFSAVNSILLRPLPYEAPDQLVRVYDVKPGTFDTFAVSPGNFNVYRDQTSSFENLAAYFTLVPLIMPGTDRPEVLETARVSPSLFPLLKVQPVIGRAFLPEEESSDKAMVVLLSQGLWQRSFGSNPGVVGQQITLSDKSYTIVGVMPGSFKFPTDNIDIWVPIGFTQKDRTRHGSHHLTVIGRLKPGAPVQQAQAELSTVAQRLAEQRPETNSGWTTKVINWQEDLVGSMKRPLWIISGAVLLVLFIACLNIVTLMLAQSISRTKEVAIRMALGASRSRVIRQLLTESVLLAIIGGILGLVLAFVGVRALSSLAADSLPGASNIAIDWRVLVFTMALAMLTGILFGLAPALQFSRPDMQDMLKEGGRGGTEGAHRHFLRKVLVVSQVGFAIVLLVGAGLLIRSFGKLRDVNPGFNPANVLAMNVSLNRTRYPKEPEQAAFVDKLVPSISTVPGVQAAAVVMPLPFGAEMNYGFQFSGQPPADPNQLPQANYFLITADYFRLMNIPVLKGRAFTNNDRENTPRVAIINDTLARKYFPTEDPIGKQINITNGTDVWREVVGVVGDVKRELDVDVKPQIYEPFLQEAFFTMTILARTNGNPVDMSEPVQRQVYALDKDQPVTKITSLETVVADTLAKRRFSMTLLAVFAGVGLVLVSIGIYGLMAYTVSQRTHEMGIRLALGASASDIVKLVVGQALFLVLIGIVIGLGASFALTRTMASLLFGVTTTDWRTFSAVAGLMIGITLLASYLPAYRAMKVSPVEALREE